MKHTYSEPSPLFTHAPHNHTATSIGAAKEILPSIAKLHARILEFVKSRGSATREEIEIGTGIAGNTARPRICELVTAGRMIENGTRKTVSGRNAAVLVVVNQGAST